MARLLSDRGQPSAFRRSVEAGHQAGSQWIGAEVRSGRLRGWDVFWSSLLNEGLYQFALYLDRQSRAPRQARTPD